MSHNADVFLGDRPQARNAAIAVGLGILGIVILLIVSTIVGVIGVTLGLSLGVALIVGSVFGQYLGFLGLSVTYFRRRGFTREHITSYLGIRWPTLRELGIVIGGYLAILLLSLVIGLFVEFLGLETAEGAERQVSGIEDPSPLLAVGALALMFFVVGPCEEVLYRGVVQGRLREHFDAVPAILIASAVFAVVHVIALAGSVAGAIVTIGILFVTANVLGFVYEYTGNIVVPTLLHAMHNSILLIVLLYGPELEQEAAVLVPALLTPLGL
jgi:membrane protease YdiL (CAAX protease family)